MPTQLSSRQLDQLRRNAKRLSRSVSIPHSEALDRIAVEQGFKNWSLLSKHNTAETGLLQSPAVAPAAPQPQSAVDPRRRYYLHGDQYEDDPSRYYCSQCDVFFLADHFATHGQHTNERFLSAEAWWAKRDASMKRTLRRPDDAINVLRAPALAARVEYEALRPAFSDWLRAQARRARAGERWDAVAVMAIGLVHARGLPTRPKSLTQLIEHYKSWGKHHSELEALEAGWAEFLSLRPGTA